MAAAHLVSSDGLNLLRLRTGRPQGPRHMSQSRRGEARPFLCRAVFTPSLFTLTVHLALLSPPVCLHTLDLAAGCGGGCQAPGYRQQ